MLLIEDTFFKWIWIFKEPEFARHTLENMTWYVKGYLLTWFLSIVAQKSRNFGYESKYYFHLWIRTEADRVPPISFALSISSPCQRSTFQPLPLFNCFLTAGVLLLCMRRRLKVLPSECFLDAALNQWLTEICV